MKENLNIAGRYECFFVNFAPMEQKSPFQNKIKIYSDGADLKSMVEMARNPLIQGLTTNPSLMKKAGVTDYKAFCLEVLGHIKDKPISFEVFSDEFKEMERQAMEINTWGKNVYVKIPVTNSKGETSAPLIEKLAHKGVKLNVTAIFTVDQVLETCLALKGGAPSIVSVFAGRVADSGRDPKPLMLASAEMCRAFGDQIELLWASSREVFNIVEAEQTGCHIITCTPDLIKKMKGFNKNLKEFSLETVKMFKDDAEAVGYTL